MNTTQAANSTVLLFGHSGGWWDFWMVISLGAVAIAGALVVIFTAGSVLVHKKEAVAASEALAKQQAITAEAQLETERIRRELAWRTISEEQSARFVAAINGTPPASLKISISALAGDAEGAQYAQELANLFRQRGFSVNAPTTVMVFGTVPEGLIMKIRDPNSETGRDAVVLQRALEAVGIPAPEAEVPSMPADEIDFLVGVKPRPEERSERTKQAS